MQRTEAQIVARTLAILEEYETNLDALKSLEDEERWASRKLFGELKKLITPFVNSQAYATQKSLKPFELFLRKWNCLIGTSFLLCYQPNALASKALIALAEELAKVFPYTPLELLLPKAIIPTGFKPSKYYNNFVVTEDGYLISVPEGLDAVKTRVLANLEAAKISFNPLLQPKSVFLDPVGKEIDPDLLSLHSEPAESYATKIRNLSRPKQADFDVCKSLRQGLIQLIEDVPIYKREKPAHKEQGKKRLMLALTKKIQTPQQLAEFLDAYVPKEEWAAFFNTIDRDELCRIMIPKRGQTAQRKDQNAQVYKLEQSKAALPAILALAEEHIAWPESDNAKRALNYAMLALYQDLRNDHGEFLDKAGGWFGGFSKTDTSQQVKVMQEFLVGDKHLSELEAHLKEQIEQKKMIAINSTTCLALKNKIIEAGQYCQPTKELTSSNVAALK